MVAVLSFDRHATERMIAQEREELCQRLHAYLDPSCLLTIKRRKIYVEIMGQFSDDELNHKACGVLRVWEGEAA